jgi:CubicO group peptidase (beta-lactamase class C family)
MNLVHFSLALLLAASVCAAARFPGKEWERRRGPNWSAAKLKEAREFTSVLKTAGVMIVQDGAIVDEWGDTTKEYMCHSMRKSFLSALYGIQVAAGRIDLEKTLADLDIDDNAPALLPTEKQASVHDLLKARSGIYHPALYETPGMRAARPLRGSHAPGTYWYYNNWDFNALGTIYEKLTGEKIHESFERRIAQAIGMQDWTAKDGSYVTGADSIHPAYPFVMSARDLARFGHLYLSKGRWNGRQIVPESWVRASVAPYSDASTVGADGYGYMWWVDKNWYSARGAGGHYIAVAPAMNLVVVHRVDTFENHSVSGRDFTRLLNMIVEAGGRSDLTPVSAPERDPPPCLSPTAACGARLYIGDRFVTYYRSHPRAGGNMARAIIMVHGTGRNGDDYYGTTLAAAAAAGRTGDTVMLAPRFRCNGCGDRSEPGEYSWSNEGWKIGAAAENSAEGKPAHSYDFIDTMIRMLNDRGRYPGLKEIVVAGHSAGGQFVQRYAAAARADSRLPIRYIVANPSSYMYLNDLRISRQRTCNEKGVCTGKFERYWDSENCTTFNKYKHGLEGLTGYVALTGVENMVVRYPKIDVTYFLGERDTVLQDSLESTCNANAQGPNRLERGLIFSAYIKQHFQAGHKTVIAQGCGHSATCMFAGPEGLRVLFPDGKK